MHHSYSVVVWPLNCCVCCWKLEAAAVFADWCCWQGRLFVLAQVSSSRRAKDTNARASLIRGLFKPDLPDMFFFFTFLKPSGSNFGIRLFPAGGKRLIYYNDIQVARLWFSCGDQTSSYAWTCPLFQVSKRVLRDFIQLEPQTCLQLISVAFLCIALPSFAEGSSFSLI